MVYVYGITAASGASDGAGRGLDGRPLEVCAAGTIAAVYTRHEAKAAPPPTTENAWRHGQVVESLMRGGAVLPARFGTTFADDAALRAALARHEGDLAAGLERLRGCVELGVRVLWEPTPAPTPATSTQPAANSGRAYMDARLAEERRRREERQRAEARVEPIHAPLAALAVDSSRRVLTTPETLLVAAYLVPRERAGAFRDRVGELGPAFPDLRVVCTGPWPPYHFVPRLDGIQSGGAGEVGGG